MNVPLTVERQIHFRRRGRRGHELVPAARLAPVVRERGRVPRVSRLAALALRFENLIQHAVARGQLQRDRGARPRHSGSHKPGSQPAQSGPRHLGGGVVAASDGAWP